MKLRLPQERTLDKRISRTQKALHLQRLESSYARGMHGYTGASRSHRWGKNWVAASGTPDELMLDDRRELVDRCGELYRNSAVPRAVVDNKTENVIGLGLRVKSTIDREALSLENDAAEAIEYEIERHFHADAQSVEIDAARRFNLYQQMGLGYRSYQIEGEIFAILPRFARRDGRGKRLRVQLLPARRCENPMQVNTTRFRDGIEFNERGEPEAYHFTKSEGYLYTQLETVRIPAFGTRTARPNVLHVFKPEFIGQSRGVPLLSPVLQELKQSDRYTKSELAAAAVQSMITGWVESDRPDLVDPTIGGSESEQPESQDYTLEPGAVYQMLPGEKFHGFDPNRPASGFRDFLEMQLTLVGMAVGLPYEMLVKKFNSSFSASKAARIEAWRHYIAERKLFEQSFCAPIFKEWLIENVASGRLNLPGFFDDPDVMAAYCAHEWFGDAQGQIDPGKETDAQIKKAMSGLSTFTREAAANGGDFEKNIRSVKREVRMLQDAGIQLDMFRPAKEEPAEKEGGDPDA